MLTLFRENFIKLCSSMLLTMLFFNKSLKSRRYFTQESVQFRNNIQHYWVVWWASLSVIVKQLLKETTLALQIALEKFIAQSYFITCCCSTKYGLPKGSFTIQKPFHITCGVNIRYSHLQPNRDKSACIYVSGNFVDSKRQVYKCQREKPGTISQCDSL